MSEVKHHVNAKTSILGRHVWMCHFEQKNYSECHKMASY